jgi:hypothetical protein
MTPERIEALRRQRALVAGHLAWLDSELAAAGDAAPAPRGCETTDPLPIPGPPPSAPSSSVAPLSVVTGTTETEPVGAAKTDASNAPESEDKLADANARANAILEQYAATDRFNPEATRRGCILSAIAALLFGITAVMVIYLIRYR